VEDEVKMKMRQGCCWGDVVAGVLFITERGRKQGHWRMCVCSEGA